MAATTQGDANVDILQPEVMSKIELISTLQQRQVKECDLESLDKNALLDIYYKSVLPMPQRKYRLNRRGQSATKQQVTMAKKKRKFTDISGESKQDTVGPRSGLITSFNLPVFSPSADRLKPPPINSERKIIRLKSKSSDLSGIVINDRTAVKSSTIKINTTSTASVSKVEGSSSAVQKASSQGGNLVKTMSEKGEGTTVKPRVIKLKRTSYGSSQEGKANSHPSPVTPTKMDESPEAKNGKDPKASPLEKSTDEDDHEVARKKFKKVSITWP